MFSDMNGMRFYIKNTPIWKKKLLKRLIFAKISPFEISPSEINKKRNYAKTTNLLRENTTSMLYIAFICELDVLWRKLYLKRLQNPTLRQNFRRTKEWMAKPMLPSYPAPFHRFSKIKWKKVLERIFHNVQKT